jgi:class 3 adenylate cyclase
VIRAYHRRVADIVARFAGFVAKFGRLEVKSAEPQTRVGIATGLVVVGDLIGEGSAREQSVVSETPKRAVRLQALAAPVRSSSTRAHGGRSAGCLSWRISARGRSPILPSRSAPAASLAKAASSAASQCCARRRRCSEPRPP